MTPELHRPLKIDTLGNRPVQHNIKATPDECVALARRFGLTALERLAAEMTVVERDGAYHVEGRLVADVVQTCVATGEPVPAHVDEPFHVRFVADTAPEQEEIELEADDCDEMTHDGQFIDIGEAVAQTLALSLDPFPRAANADEILRAAGVLSEGETGPFAALKALKFKEKDA